MSQVAVYKQRDYQLQDLEEVLDRGMEALGGWDRWIQPGMKVLLKPNLISPRPPEAAATTHPELVRALTRHLQGRGCEVWIGDSSGGAIAGRAVTGLTLVESGIEQVAREEGAVLKNFDREGTLPVKVGGRFLPELHVARPVKEADLVINLPKLKTHIASVFTGAVKNLFGCIPGLAKARLHRLAPSQEDLGELLVEIHRACGVDLHIMDAVTAMDGPGPTAGRPRPVGALLLSPDPLAVDVVALALVGGELREVPSLKVAAELGLGTGNQEGITLLGDRLPFPMVEDFSFPPGIRSPFQSRFIFDALVPILQTRPVINPGVCQDCQVCVGSCPVQAIAEDKTIAYQDCIQCLCCHELCPHQAVEMKHIHPLGPVAQALTDRGRKYFEAWFGQRRK